ncbi:amidohydrolase family protein [Streptomyces shenzhenensis]|uniref:amidohydrolase family protein n=1 Tax=Streptomyces shenzhenensis TaxID=943815 RepID=UPI00369C4F40
MTLLDTSTKLGIIDTDVHPLKLRERHQRGSGVLSYLPRRWQERVEELGVVRDPWAGGERVRLTEFQARGDAVTPDGNPPGSDPDFAAEQLLDMYEISAAILNDLGAFGSTGLKHQPTGFSAAYCRALNEHRRDTWLAADSRWYSSISLSYELPDLAVKEIEHCKTGMGEYGDRFRQVLFAPDNLRPPGHPSYWPIYEACEHHDLPVAFHILTGNRASPSGSSNYYYEHHAYYVAYNFPLVASYIFEGVFDRFPNLKIALIEQGWSWVLQFGSRLDAVARTLGSEVRHLQKRPSEYLRDNFWFSTQPMEEPEKPEQLDELLDLMFDEGLGDKLMFSSDYAHWDFDEPSVLPASLSLERRASILGGSASRLYGIDLIPGYGYEV